MNRDALIAGAENGVNAIETVDRGAAGAWFAFVTRRGRVVEVVTTRSLQQIPAVGGHIAELRGCAGQDRSRKKRVPVFHLFVVRGVGVRHERAEAKSAVGKRLDPVQRQTRDVD